MNKRPLVGIEILSNGSGYLHYGNDPFDAEQYGFSSIDDLIFKLETLKIALANLATRAA